MSNEQPTTERLADTIRSGHEVVGRLAAAAGRSVTFCNCGLAFFGANGSIADSKWQKHAKEPQR